MEASLRKVLVLALSVLLLASLVGCQESDSNDSSGDSSTGSAEQQQALEEAQREVTRAREEAEQARRDAEEAREEAEAASEPDAGGESDEAGSTETASGEPPQNTPELSPSETLEAQYDYMGSGQYEEAYYMLAEQSQRLVSLEQYVGFFPDSYQVSEYSVNSEQIGRDTATVQADLVVSDSQRGVQQYPITQEFVLVDGEWRVILRDDQIETFAAVQTPEQAPPEGESSGETAVSGSDVVVRVTGSGAFSGNYGTLETSRSVDGVAPAEYSVEDLDTGVSSFDSVTAVMQKTGAGANELGVQVVVGGEVVRESSTSAEYGVAQVSWSPSD